MGRNRTWSDDDLRVAVTTSHTYSQTAVALGLYPGNKTCKRVREKIEELDIDISHFVRGRSFTGLDGKQRRYMPDDQVFTQGVKYNANHRKRYLQLVKYECQGKDCGISEWRGKPLILDIDHVNGDRYDNRLENLALLCPNCHRQTETWGSGNKQT